MYTGKQIFMESLVAENVEYIFGNPGTTELPLIESLQDYPGVRYIMALHESVAVTMADAYAHASGRVAVANLHVAPGLGNGLGSLYNAWEGHTPMIVTAGQQHTRLRLREPLLGHDLVAMAAPLVKWSVQAESADELPLIMNRAFKTAREAPTGPVFVSLPMDVMDQKTQRAPIPPSRILHRSEPDPEGLGIAVDLLARSTNPAIVCGNRVAASGATRELVRLAENIGARVYAEVLPSRLGFPNLHPCFRGRGLQDHRLIRGQLAGADVVLLIAGEFFEEIWHVEGSPFPDKALRIQIDPTPARIGRNHRVDCGLVADPLAALRAINAGLASEMDDTARRAAGARMDELRAVKEAERREQRSKADAPRHGKAMSPARLMAELDAALPPDVAISGEAITASWDLLRTLALHSPDDLLAARGGGIGQGLPSTLGMKLAQPERPVLCLSGDGSALYTIQTLWTAAHHKIPVVFLVLNNGAYRILKLNMNRYRKQTGVADRGYPHMDLSEPGIDFLSLARGFGVAAERVEAPQAIGPAVKRAFEAGKPRLIDVVVEGSV